MIAIPLLLLAGCVNLDKLKSYFPQETPAFPAANIPTDPSSDMLKNPGRLIEWTTPGGKRVEQYDTGYFPGWFADNIADHWDGICALYEARTGDATLRAGGNRPARIECKPVSWFEPNGMRVPDKVEWTIWYRNGHSIVFWHGHSADCVSPYYHVRDPQGRQRSSAPANHPHCYDGKRVDIRYTQTPQGWDGRCAAVNP